MNTLDNMNARRSIHMFEPGREIPVDKIKEIIKQANLSPSSFNLQPWEVIIVSNPEKKKTLRQGAFDQPKVEESSAVLIIIANPNAVEENLDSVLNSWVELGYMGEDDAKNLGGMAQGLYGEKDKESRRLFAVKNASLFAMSFMLAAKDMGFETHPMDGIDPEKIKKDFGIPEDRLVPMLITIGYKKEGFELLPRAFRRKIEDFVKINSY